MTDLLCVSGGARGADVTWGEATLNAGGRVRHYSFDGHVCPAPPETLHVLSREELLRADPHIIRASRALRRTTFTDPETDEVTRNLLRRDWYQVLDTTSCYAVSEIFPTGHVKGGTGYAVELFKERERLALDPCPLYVFDQAQAGWFVWRRSWARWDALPGAPPRPTGAFTGIGTRQLGRRGRRAIWEVLR